MPAPELLRVFGDLYLLPDCHPKVGLRCLTSQHGTGQVRFAIRQGKVTRPPHAMHLHHPPACVKDSSGGAVSSASDTCPRSMTLLAGRICDAT
jgi:hypothetical protein